MEKRREELCTAIAEAKNNKKKVLEEQLSLIQGEKDKVSLRKLIKYYSAFISS